MPESVLPVLLALSAGFLFACGTQLLNLGLRRHGDPQTATLLDIGTAAVVYWLFSPLFVKGWFWLTIGTLIFMVLGVFRPFISSSLAARSIHYVGPTLTATFSATTPLFGAAFGIFMLGEHFTLPIAVGTMTIIVALVILSWRGRIETSWPLWALAFPLGAAIVRSGANAFVKVGLDYVPEPFYVGFVGYSVSFVVALIAQVAARKPMPNFAQRPGLLWFSAAGTCHAFAVMMVNTSLQLAPVIIVLPLVSIYPFFTLALSLLVFRREVLTPRTILAVLLVVPGVLLIGVFR